MTGSVGARMGLGLRPLGRSDRALVRRAAGGDDAAFAAIFERYHQDLYRYCLSILRDPDDAQDALQNTIAAALRSLPGERREIELRPWLFRVAHNNAISLLRARRPTVGPEAIAELPGADGEERLGHRERLRGLLGDLELLSEQQRAALTLRELSGLSFDEIAGTLSISAQAARQAVYEARVGLRQLEEGREMDCDRVCSLVSDGDRRALRAKQVRAHLRACSSCRDFREAIGARESELAALFPPLPAAAAAGLLQAALGTGAGAGAGAGATGILGGGAAVAGKGFAGSVAAKSVASVVAATAIGVGAADYGGLIDAPLIGDGHGAPAAERHAAPQGAPEAASPAGRLDLQASPRGEAGGSAVAGSEARRGHGPPAHAEQGDRAGANGKGDPRPPAHSNAGGNSANTPAAGASGNAAAGPPAHSQAGGAPPAHSSAGGQPAGGGPQASASQGNAAPGPPPGAGPRQAPASEANAGGAAVAIAQGAGRPAEPLAGPRD